MVEILGRNPGPKCWDEFLDGAPLDGAPLTGEMVWVMSFIGKKHLPVNRFFT
jgi:hypothetical protein